MLEKIQRKNSENHEKNLEELQNEVQASLDDFQKHRDTSKLFKNLTKLKKQNSKESFEDAWQEEQVEKFLDILNDDSLFLEISNPNYFENFLDLLCQGEEGDNDNANPLNQRIYSLLMEKLKQSPKKGMSDFLLEVCNRSSLFEYDTQTDNDFSQSFFGADYLIEGCQKTHENNPENLFKNLKIIHLAENFLSNEANSSFYGRYMESGMQNLLGKINSSDNYFLQQGVASHVSHSPLQNESLELKKKLLLAYHCTSKLKNETEILHEFNFYLRDNEDFYYEALFLDKKLQIEKYDEQNLRETSSLEPLFGERNFSAYGKISHGIAIIYDLNGKIDSFFTLGKNQRRLSLPEVLKQEGFVQESLSPEKYKNLLYNYHALLEIPLREKIENNFKIKLNQFSIREQLQFLNFISQKNTAEIEKVKNVLIGLTDQEKINHCLKSFLSLEHDQQNGQKIIEIAEKLSPEDAKKVFAKISQLADLAQEQSETLGAMIFEDGETKIPSGVQTELLRKTHQIITLFAQEINANEPDQTRIKQLLNELEQNKIQITVLATVLKKFQTAGQKIDYELIKNLQFLEKPIGQNLTEEEKQQILAIAKTNWEKDNPAIAPKILADLQQQLETNNISRQRAYVLKYQNEVIAFCRFEQTGENEVHAGSLNVFRDLRGVDIGKFVMDKVLTKEAEENIVRAETSLKNKANGCYVERYGFVLDGIIADSYNTGEPFFTAKIDKELNRRCPLRNEGKPKENSIGTKEIADLWQKQQTEGKTLEQMIQEKKELIVLKFESEKDFEKIAVQTKLLLDEKDDDGNVVQKKEVPYEGVRYVKNKQDNSLYLVFRRKID